MRDVPFETDRTAIIIPTRDRADLVANAIRSVTSQNVPCTQILVSDNSTRTEDSQKIATACRNAGARVHYVRPPTPMPMAEHWDWAIQAARHLIPSGRFLLLSSRWVFRDGGLGTALQHSQRHPNAIL